MKDRDVVPFEDRGRQQHRQQEPSVARRGPRRLSFGDRGGISWGRFHKGARTPVGFKLSQITRRLATDDTSDSMAISFSLDYAPTNRGSAQSRGRILLATTLPGGYPHGL